MSLTATETATAFDFSVPRRISPGGQHALREWQEILCASVTENCSTLVDGLLVWKVDSLETLKTQEALSFLEDRFLMYHIDLEAGTAPSLIYWNRESALGLISSLLGTTDAPKARELTVVEQALLEMVLDRWTRALSSSWPAEGILEPTSARLSNVRFARKLLDRTDDLVVIRYVVATPLGDFATSWMVPKSFLEEHLVDVSESDEAARLTDDQTIEVVSSEIPVGLVVELGRKMVPLSRITAIQEHDVLILDQSIHEPLRILVEGNPKLAGIPGRSGNRQLIRITSLGDA